MKQKAYLIFILTLVVLFPLLTSCNHDPVNINDLEPVCFDTQVLPILQTSCGMAGCHDGTEEGFLATDYSSVILSVKPGDPRGSALYKAITDIHSDDMMPPDQPLTKLQRNIIQVWITQGAIETICSQDTSENPVKTTCFVQDILPMMLSSCGTTGCHDAVTREEDYQFTDYNSIKEGIVPFNPSESEIFEAITDDGDDRMPPAPRPALTPQQIAALREWITDGALNSDCPSNNCDTADIISFSTHVSPVLKANCTGCHNATLSNGNVNLSTYNGVLTAVQNVRNGTSLLSGSVNKMAGFIAMPPTFDLEVCSISILDKWIAEGATNN